MPEIKVQWIESLVLRLYFTGRFLINSGYLLCFVFVKDVDGDIGKEVCGRVYYKRN